MPRGRPFVSRHKQKHWKLAASVFSYHKYKHFGNLLQASGYSPLVKTPWELAASVRFSSQILHDANTFGAAARGLWWWIMPPGIMIAITGLAFVFIGNALDAIINPKLKR